MVKWQYYFLSSEVHNDCWRPKFQSIQVVPDWKKITTTDFCNMLGDEGWEIVSVTYSPSATYQNIVFKRPKP